MSEQSSKALETITEERSPASAHTEHFPVTTPKKKSEPPLILLVEDNPADVQLLVEAFRESKFDYHLRVANNGAVAMQYLRMKGTYHQAKTPDLIILDLNLPRKDGRTVLAEIKQDTTLKRIPVIILSVSQAEEDILMSYELSANCFISKPVDLNDFMAAVKQIREFWLSTVKLPPDWGVPH
ncbi:MAG TPA: response regulator [Bdellovibrionota bacterium]|nr:response regulator [Bdellovibrionota bacterium]